MLNFSIFAAFLAAEDQIHQLCQWIILVNFDPVLAGEGRNVPTVVSSGCSGSALAHPFTSAALPLCARAESRATPLLPFQAFSAIPSQNDY